MLSYDEIVLFWRTSDYFILTAPEMSTPYFPLVEYYGTVEEIINFIPTIVLIVFRI